MGEAYILVLNTGTHGFQLRQGTRVALLVLSHLE